MRVGQLILLGEGLAAISLSPFAPDPLLQAACLIVGVVSAYSAFYLKRRLGFFAAGYALSLGAVGLFTLSKHPIARFAGWEGVSVIAWALVAYGRGGTPRSFEAALVGFAVNRLGDAFWVASLLSPEWTWGFILGGWVKAALFPLTFWLVQVMYAPIPVSALLHSALLVALGVYGPIQEPAWLHALPLKHIQLAAEVAALVAAMGAFLSRVPKSALAWTTSAHLALAAALWAEPPLAQKALLTHAYLKASLFLLLGLVQKSLAWTAPLRLIWLLTVVLLSFAATPLSPLSLVAEGLTAFTLVRFWRAYPMAGKTPWPVVFPILLTMVGAIYLWRQGLSWHSESLLPLLGAAAGLALPWPRRAYRLDKALIRLFHHLERGWQSLAYQTSRAENALLQAYDRLFTGLLVLMRGTGRVEVQLIDRVWRPLLRRLRTGLEAWVHPAAAWGRTYQPALQWAFVITLLIFAVWRYFS